MVMTVLVMMAVVMMIMTIVMIHRNEEKHWQKAIHLLKTKEKAK